MSLQLPYRVTRDGSFPRVSGDEPVIPARIVTHRTFSPRERG